MKRFIISFITALILASGTAVPVYASTIKDLQNKKTNVKKQQTEAQKLLESTKQEKTSAVAEMLAVDADLDIVTEELEVINRELDKTKELYDSTKQELDSSIEEKNKQLELFKNRVRFMYMRGKTGYLDVLFSSKDFADLANRIEYVNRIVAYDQKILTSLQESEKTIKIKLDETELQKTEMQILSNQKSAKQANLEEALAQKKQIVNRLEKDQDKYAEMIKNLNDTDKNISSMISKKQKEAEAAAKAKNTTVAASYKGGKLAWPVPARGKITSNYGNRKHPISKKIEFHKGVDIPAPSGSSIVSAEGGTVISTGRQSGYGLTVVVDHGNGLSTLYAHCSKINVKVGQKVKRGENIAKVGSTGYSTGPHLHFEVRVKGKTTNPVSYLK